MGAGDVVDVDALGGRSARASFRDLDGQLAAYSFKPGGPPDPAATGVALALLHDAGSSGFAVPHRCLLRVGRRTGLASEQAVRDRRRDVGAQLARAS